MSAAALINCYGHYEPNRSDIELEGLRQYNAEIANLLDQRIKSNEIGVIVICGGFTDNSNQSEAESNKSILLDSLINSNNIPIVLQNTGHNTYENLALGYLTARNWTPDKIIVFCDTPRITKVKVEVAGIFGSLIQTEVISVNRSDTHLNSNYQKQTEEILPQEIFGQHFELWSQLIQSYLVKSKPKVYSG